MTKYKYLDENKRHLHTFDDKPLLGTSSVVGVISKPLTWWASGLACEKLGWTNSKIKVDGKYTTISQETRINAVFPHLEAIKSMSEEEFLALLDEAYKAHSVKLDDSAEKGTDLHAVLEDYVKSCIEGNDGKPLATIKSDKEFLAQFAIWACEYVEEFIYSEMNVFSERLWTGGIFDVAFKLKDGKICIGDFKSSKESYQSQFIQVAGYDIQQSENGMYTPNGEKIGEPLKIDAYYVFPFGSTNFRADVRYNTNQLKNGFESAVTLYKLMN